MRGAEVGVLLIRPNNEEFRYSIIFMFLVTNNITEYKALLAGLKMEKKIGADKVTVYADS